MTTFAVPDTAVEATDAVAAVTLIAPESAFDPNLRTCIFVETANPGAGRHLAKFTRNVNGRWNILNASNDAALTEVLTAHPHVDMIIFCGSLTNNDATTTELIVKTKAAGVADTIVGLTVLASFGAKMSRAGCSKVMSPWNAVADPRFYLNI